MQLIGIAGRVLKLAHHAMHNILRVLTYCGAIYWNSRLLQHETDKNRLEMLLNNNLLKKLERAQGDLQEMTGEDRKQKLELQRAELESINHRQADVNKHFKGFNLRLFLFCNIRSLFFPIQL